jgi:ZIP family zinc transporter
MLLAAVLDHFVPHQEYDEKSGEAPHKNQLRLVLSQMFAIGLHNFPEGIATFMAGYENAALGISIAVAIAFHNIPEGIAVAMPIYFGSGTEKKPLAILFSPALQSRLALCSRFWSFPLYERCCVGAVFSLVAGIMMYIAIEELIPSSRQYGHDRMALVTTLAGIAIMPLTAII